MVLQPQDEAPNANTPLLGDTTQVKHHAARNTGEETTIIEEDIPLAKLVIIMCTSWLGIFLAAVDSTIIATVSGPISSEFNSLQMFS